ncbi:recombinase family protein [Anaerotignum sp.]|uniref:recombinase family protein n=1 Tax=Anaerotignum sp. TaxID=2039241 RepID=UPI0028AA2F03|nr:recombinase family protein [Anaerotignum sp.]
MARKSRKNITEVPNIESSLLKTAIYVRLSVEDNKNRGNSIDTQRQIIENFIAITPELEVLDTYIDNGLTGRNFDRPEFNRMLADIEKGKVQCVIVKDLSRLGRNSISTGYYVEKHFPLHGVRFIAVTDNFDTATDLNGANNIILPLKNMINEAYSMDIAKKIKAQQQQAMKEGQFVGSRPPYGYQKAPTDCHKLIIDPETASVVGRIFELTAQGMGLAPICRVLNEENILTPSQYAQSKGIINHDRLVGSGAWQTRTLMKILSSEVYMGDMVQGKSKSVNRKQMPNSEEKWITVQDTHDPIISRELFADVQAIREGKAVKHGGAWEENIFKGKIFCGYCGKNLHRQTAKRVKGDIYVFHCISNTRIAKGYCDGHIYFKEEDLKQAVVNIVQIQADILVGKNKILQGKQKEMNEKIKAMDTQLADIAKEVSKYQKYLKSLYENLVLGIIDLGEYKNLKAGYEEKIEVGRNQHFELTTHKENLLKQASSFANVTKEVVAISSVKKLNRELIERLIEKILVKDGNELEIAFTFQHSFPLLEEVLNHG